MIYLGEQTAARVKYAQKAFCYLNKKLFGSFSSSKPDGYKCEQNDCDVCSINFHVLDLGAFNDFIKPYLSDIISVRWTCNKKLDFKLSDYAASF